MRSAFRFFSPLLFICCITLAVKAQSDCGSATYIKRLGDFTTVERGLSLAYSTIDNAIYIVGSKDDSLSIIKLNLNDDIEWIRNFDIVKQKGDNAHKIIVDSEGMLVIAGTAGQFNVLGEVFAFRYDPNANTVIWSKRYLSYTNCFNHGLEELTPGDDFLMSNNPSVSGNNDEQILFLDRQTGDIIPERSFHVDLGDSEALNDVILHEGFLYGNGRYTDGPDFRDMRNTTTKIDPATGASVWTLLGHVSATPSARLYGAGMVIDQGEIFSISVGDENGTSIDDTEIWIQKTNLEGQVKWINKYELPGTGDWVDEIISSDGGFVVLARTREEDGHLYLIKIDRDGNVLWAKSFNLSQKNYSLILGSIQGALQQIGEHLYFTAFSEQGTNEDLVLVKTDLNGNVSDSCGLVSDAQITVTPVNNPVFYLVEPDVFDYNPDVISDAPFATTSTISQLTEVCFSPGEIQSEVIKSICLGTNYDGYNKTGTYIDTFVTASGCDSIRTLILSVTECKDLILYDLNACTSFMGDGSNMDYSEFVPLYSNVPSCAGVSASVVYRNPPQENKHSCTPGLNGTEAMCITALPGCTYTPGDPASLVIEITIDPEQDGIFNWTGLEFYEKGPMLYNWISGPSGMNNYPTLYGIRILRDGSEIFAETDIPTSLNWANQSFNFIDNPLFRVTAPTLFRIELLPYCPIGNGAEVSAWDIEDIIISGGCTTPPQKKPVISGDIQTVFGQPYAGPQMVLSTFEDFTNATMVSAHDDGYFQFDQLQEGAIYFLKGFNPLHPTNGLSTLDLITIQKHLLGITPLTNPGLWIAADVDRNGSINVLDMLIIRKLLLGIYETFPTNTSWRFGILPQGETLEDVYDFQDVWTIESLGKDTTNLHVTAVKIGDLTGDAKSNFSDGTISIRSENQFMLMYKDQWVEPGKPVTISFRTNDVVQLEGMQFSLDIGGAYLEEVSGQMIPIQGDHFHILPNGRLNVSWHTGSPVTIADGDILFSVTIMPQHYGRLSDLLRFENEMLNAEAYSPSKVNPENVTLVTEEVYESTLTEFSSKVAPNPFRDRTILYLEMGHESQVEIRLYSVTGELLATQNGFYGKGTHKLDINAGTPGLSDRLLFLQVCSDQWSQTHKLVLLD